MKHVTLISFVDDITIGNAYASEKDLKAVSEVFFADNLKIKVDVLVNNVGYGQYKD